MRTGEEQRADEEHNGVVHQRSELLPAHTSNSKYELQPWTSDSRGFALVERLLDERLELLVEGQEEDERQEGQSDLSATTVGQLANEFELDSRQFVMRTWRNSSSSSEKNTISAITMALRIRITSSQNLNQHQITNVSQRLNRNDG